MQLDRSNLTQHSTAIHHLSTELVSGSLIRSIAEHGRALLVCIHGGGCNGNYFNLKGCSTVAAGAERGYPVLLVTRPGYGRNRVSTSDAPIETTAPLIRRFIDDVRAKFLPNVEAIVMIGHSIGGAVALTMANDADGWPLRGLAVSGIGDRPCPKIKNLRLPQDQSRIEPPAGLADALFFSGGEPLSWRAVASLRAAAEPWLRAEVTDVMERWPIAWPMISGEVAVPVHLRLAEHEKIWEADEVVVSRMARSLVQSPRVDAALMKGGGHLFEVSKRGPELIRSQLDFLDESSSA